MALIPASLKDAPELDAIVAFLRGLGIVVREGALPDDCFVPGMTVRDGALIYDPLSPGWVRDLLHEGGHLAVTDPAIRATLPIVLHDPAEEMAALAWSYAAAMAIGLPIGTLFHAGYKGGPEYLINAFTQSSPIGLPMLQYWGMAACGDAVAAGEPAYPAMRTWLRTR